MGTYGYISIIAMLCYGFMLLMFLAAKRNKIINSFWYAPRQEDNKK